MTIPLFEKNLSGTTITDEPIYCDEAYVINGTTYYRGFMSYVGTQVLWGTSSANYGVWTAPAKGGTRKNVIFAGEPTAADVLVDVVNGTVISTTSTTYYMRYIAIAPLRHNATNITLDFTDQLLSGTSGSIRSFTMPYYGQFRGYSWNVYGTYPSAECFFNISNGTDNQSFSISGSGVCGAGDFSGVLKLTKNQTMTLSVDDGLDIGGFTIYIWQL